MTDTVIQSLQRIYGQNLKFIIFLLFSYGTISESNLYMYIVSCEGSLDVETNFVVVI